MDQLDEAARSAVTGVFPEMGLDTPTIVDCPATDGVGASGAFIDLAGGPEPVRLALFAQMGANEWMARTMLYMEDDETIDPDDISDAVCEATNMLAGAVKRELAKVGLKHVIGLPVFLEGELESLDGQLRTLRINMGGHSFSLALYKGGDAGGAE